MVVFKPFGHASLPSHPFLLDNLFKYPPSRHTRPRMKIDPHKNKERWESWKKKN